MKIARMLLIALVAALPVNAQEPERRPMTTDDGLDMVRVGSALIAPDGSWVLFSRSELDWEKNKRKTTWWRVSSEGGEAYRYVGEEGASSPRFSPDGRYLAFKRTVDKKAQLFLMRTEGGEAVQWSKHESSVGSYGWTDDGSRIFFVADEPRSKEEEKRHKDGYDAIYVDEGPNGQRAAAWSNLWVLEVGTKEETRLTELDQRIGAMAVSPDGSRVAFTARFENRRNQGNQSEIYLLDVESKEVRRLTENAAPERGLRWAPDGRRLAYLAPSDREWELRNAKVWVMDVDAGSHRMVSGAFEGNVREFVWTADGSALLFGGLHHTDSNLYRLDVTDGRVTQVTHETGTLSPASFSRDRARMVYTFQDLTTPPDLYTSPTDALRPTRLTDANPWLAADIALGEGEVVRWQSRDGTGIEGILMLPPDYEEGSRIPLLLHVHGGPAGVFTNSFRSSYQVWAGLGYAQLMPNVRGSSGYGDELLRGNMNDIGGGDYWDLMTGVDYVVSRGVADPDQLGIRGWSYGGILGGYTLTRTNRFKGASLGAMVSDWTSEYGPGFNYDVRLWYIGGTPWDNPEDFRQRSALTHVTEVTTPTLLLHGMSDRTDTEAQSMNFFQALKDQGKTTRYIRFPREPHGFREPRHQRTRDLEEIRWIQKYVRGVDWTPWERKAEDKKEEKDKSVASRLP